jgi:hypothetical protein
MQKEKFEISTKKIRGFSKRVANFVYKFMFDTKVKPLFFYLSPQVPPLHKCGEGDRG